VFPVSRLVVDPERFVDDATEPMAACGMGVIYTQTSQRMPLRYLDEESGEKLPEFDALAGRLRHCVHQVIQQKDG
jgi:hypothetical protein